MDKTAFKLSEGMVLPVAERVFTQLKAASVLGVSRMRAAKPEEAEKKTKETLDNLRAYAEKFGKDRAEKEFIQVSENFLHFAASPMAAKQAVMDANRTQRSSKDFDKK